MYRGQDKVLHKIMVTLHFFISELWPFCCFMLILCHFHYCTPHNSITTCDTFKKFFLEICPRRYFFCGSFMFFCLVFAIGTSFVVLLCFSVLCLLCLYALLLVCALWSPAGKALTSWLSFVVSKCEFVTFPLVSWVRCGT